MIIEEELFIFYDEGDGNELCYTITLNQIEETAKFALCIELPGKQTYLVSDDIIRLIQMFNNIKERYIDTYFFCAPEYFQDDFKSIIKLHYN